MKEIPEILMKCCGKIYKPHSIKILDDYVEIVFFCSICKNLIHLECRNGMKKRLYGIDSIKESKKLPFKYNNIKKQRSDINE